MGLGAFNIFGSKDYYLDSLRVSAASTVNESLGNGIASDLFYGVLAQGGGGIGFVRNLLRNHGFLVDTVTRERLVFQYNVQGRESGGANYANHEVLARSVPQYHYKGGKERTLELPLTFTMQERSRSDIRRAVRFLQALAYPDYSQNSEASIAPHPVVVVQGRLYAHDTWLVRDFSVQWGNAMDPVTQLPSEVQVNLTLIEMRTRGKSYNEVIRL
jgi:hypothetical protein